MASKYLLFLTLVQIFNAIKSELPEGVTIAATNNCTTADFNPDCTIQCQLSFEDGANSYNYIGQWLYSDDETLAESVTIFDGSECSTNSDDNFQCSLHLTNNKKFTSTNYYAGEYFCNYKAVDSEISYEDHFLFIIDENAEGKLIGEDCDMASECLALDAQCSTLKKCQCSKPYDISYTDEDTNIACLSASTDNGPCNIDEQCKEGGSLLQPLYCYDQICKSSVALLEPCEGDKYCSDKTENSICNSDGVCNCEETASVSTDVKECQTSGVSIVRDQQTSKLTCTVTVPNPNYKCVAFQWTYKSFRNSSDNVTIFDGKSESITEISYTETLSLDTYNSGYYFCQFTFLNEINVPTQVNAVFQISSTDGVLMGGICTASEDCATLNATCMTDYHNCTCTNDYSVEYNPDPDSPACLSMKGEGESCNTNIQCIEADQTIDCVDFKCTCTGTPTYISEIGQTLCISPAAYGSGCRYDEQCTLSYEGTACNNLICGCDEDWEYSDSTFQCEKTLSGGAIAGIVIGCLVGVAVIVVIIICLVRK